VIRSEVLAPTRETFETAAEHLATRVPIASPSSSVAEIRRSLEGQRFDSAVTVAICDEGRLVGLLTVEELCAAAGDASAGEVMDLDPPVVAPGTDQEIAAWQAVRRGENTLAVVDERGRFARLVPPGRLLTVRLWEHEEDIARLGGFLHDTAAARATSEELISRRFFHRLPWLLLGLAGRRSDRRGLRATARGGTSSSSSSSPGSCTWQTRSGPRPRP
jgi:magnesium transporter